jgi:PAS domain S-box-containing protein
MRAFFLDAAIASATVVEAILDACRARGHEVVLADAALEPGGLSLAPGDRALVVAFGPEAVARGRAAFAGNRSERPMVLGVGDDAERLLAAGAHDVLITPCGLEEARARLFILERRASADEQRANAGQRVFHEAARTRALFHSKMLGILEWAFDGSVLDANDALLEMIGYTQAELEGGRINWSAMTPREYWPLEERAGAEILASGVCTPFEKEYIRKDGTRVPIFIGGAAYDELSARGISFVIDISDRKAVEQQLRESNERYEIVARATTDAVWDWDITSGKLTWNKTFHTLFGYTKEEVGADLSLWIDLIPPADRERVTGSLDRAVAGGDVTWSSEYRFLAASGRYAHVADRGYITRAPGGTAVRAIGAMVDVTERREMQERLLLADRLASMGTLAAGVAHEINNPLTHVIGNLDVALRGLTVAGSSAGSGAGSGAGGVPAVQLRGAIEALSDAQQGAERVKRIVRDLRTFSRVDEARHDLIDVHKPLEWATRIVGPEIARRARLVTDFGEVPEVLGDDSRLGQVFVNLLVNAAQAIPEGDPTRHGVTVATARGTLGAQACVVVTVRDTGSGIAPEVRGRIFDPFFTTKDVGVGTGLGLSICHGIVSALGGAIEVDSDVGRGSEFRVFLPIAPPVRAPPTPSARAATIGAAPRRGRVLIVDDDRLTRALLERILGIEHDVVAVASAEEALALVRGGERFDVVFSDLMMPSMTGMDLHQALGALAPAQAERVVFLTAGAVTPGVQRFLAECENPWLEKPFDPAALLALVRRLLSEGEPRDSPGA